LEACALAVALHASFSSPPLSSSSCTSLKEGYSQRQNGDQRGAHAGGSVYRYQCLQQRLRALARLFFPNTVED
jgi:hypothetical protein